MNPIPDTEADPTTETSSTALPMSAVQGRCDERFTAIKALAEQLAMEDDDGFALAVEVDSELVVDLWAGRASEASLIHTPELSTEVARCAIADALGHRCGLIGVPNGSIEGLIDWDASIAAIATSKPLRTHGAAHGEHAFTYGHLIGELVRRITGQSIGSLIRSETTEAHDIDVHIGLL